MDYKISCPHCWESLKIPKELLDQPFEFECPACNGHIKKIPKGVLRQPMDKASVPHKDKTESPPMTTENRPATGVAPPVGKMPHQDKRGKPTTSEERIEHKFRERYIMPQLGNAVPDEQRYRSEVVPDEQSIMINFVRGGFRIMFILSLWLTVIGCPIAGGIMGSQIASLGGIEEGMGVILGVVIGLVIGTLTVIFTGGIVAIFLNIDANIQKIAMEMKERKP